MPQVKEACRAACNSSTSFGKEEFLCSGDYVDQQFVIGRYKYDPCPNDGTTLEEFLDPLGSRAQEAQKRQDFIPVIAALAAFLLAGLIIISVTR